MEHLVRICNEQDQQTLVWLRRHVGDAALTLAIQHCTGSHKPYLSAVCRRLGVNTPAFYALRRPPSSPIAEHALASIRRILAVRTAPTSLARLSAR
jgi:hypothetical protein